MAKSFSKHTWNTFNHHQNTQFTNHTYQTTQNNGNANHIMAFKTTNISCDHQGIHIRRSFWSDSIFNNTFPHEHHNCHLHNPNITLNYPEATSVEQVRYGVNEASQLVLVMVNKAIIKAAISSVKTFDGNKKQIWSMENISWKCSTNLWSRHLTNNIFKNSLSP